MYLKRIPIDNHPDLVELIETTYNGGRVFGTYVHKITMDGEDINIELDLEIEGARGIHGTVQMELDEDEPICKKIREIIELEEGHD